MMITGVRVTIENLEDGEPTGIPLIYTFEKGTLEHCLNSPKDQECMKITLWTGCETFDDYQKE